MIGLSWCVGVCISIPPLFGWKDPARNDPSLTGQCLISQDWGYTVFSTLGAFYLPLIVMIIIYIKIYSAAKSRIRKKHMKGLSKAQPLLNHSGGQPTQGVQVSAITTQSPEPSSNGSAPLDDPNRNNKHMQSLTPPASPLLREQTKHMQSTTPPASPLLRDQTKAKGSFLDITKLYFEGRLKASSPNKKERAKEKLEQKRERKAARTLGIITGAFVMCWLPFFAVAVVRPFCGDECHYPDVLIAIIGWLGYFNSLLNPIIYTVFNPDFRCAFRKILFGKYNSRQNWRR